ncbi:hypothetical protein NJH78_25460 [Pseudomonas chlororaphis]|uniref:hypothetical protein n=1 Tax=Pseudomonas chlororaphis TaxID=587753 RepID=UPI00209BA031|nr:hypothetical protein [Pseudomonas chlororaphis]MCO7573343.1 hypothetical protein [Pseudomonas chlororaphis]MCO7591263.1 hypothetical protein [Pseudomonas chlororaphis]
MRIDKERLLLDTIYIVDEYLAKSKPGQNIGVQDGGASNTQSKPLNETLSVDYVNYQL